MLKEIGDTVLFSMHGLPEALCYLESKRIQAFWVAMDLHRV